MYLAAYKDAAEFDSVASRASERTALLHACDLLLLAEQKGVRSVERVEALLNVRRLWTFFVEQLGQPGNALPPELRASLISIGLWVLAEEERIRNGESHDFAGIIEISRITAAGLAA